MVFNLILTTKQTMKIFQEVFIMSEQSSVKKKYKKVILGDQKFDLDEGLSVEEILEAIKEDNPA